MNPHIMLGAVFAFVLSVGGAYFYGRHDGQQIEIAKQAKVEAVAARIRDEVAVRTAEQIAAIEVKHVTVRQLLDREIVEKPVYRECRADDRVLQLINSALTGEAIPVDYRELPSADASD